MDKRLGISFLTFIIIMLKVFNVHAQLKNDYFPMTSSGEIPEMFITGIKNRYKTAVTKIDKEEKRKYKNDRKEFYLESNNEIDLFLKSGLVVFNDSVNNYVNAVAQQLLAKQDNQLKDNLIFYPIKFDYSNAFAFNEGIVFVNVGLLARLNSEAELAFILGHEGIHYLKKHSIKHHIESKKAKRGEGSYRKTSLEQQTKAVARFSRQHESEADLLGFKMLEQSDYNPYAAISALEGLNYSNTPVLHTPFNKSTLEKGLIRIPRKYEVDLPSQNVSKEDQEDDEDSIASHPALGSRIAAIEAEIKPGDSLNKSYFPNGEERFYYIRDLARMELCRLYLLSNDLDNALYLSSALLQQYPDNIYLKRILATTLYRLAIAANHSNVSIFLSSIKSCPPELVYQNTVLRKMTKEELSLVALRHVWETKTELAGYPDMQEISKKLMTDYIVTYKRKITAFPDAKTFSDSLVESFYKEPPIDTTKIATKTKGRKTRKAKTPYDFNKSFASFALSDLIATDAEFVKQYNEILKSNGLGGKNEAGDSEEKDEEKTHQEIVIKTEKKNELSQEPIDGLILIEPEYSRTDYRKKLIVNYVANEEIETNLRDIIKFCAHKADFNLTLLSANNIEANEAEVFNEYTVLKEWLYECFKQGKYNTNTVPTDFNRLKLIGQKYNTRYAAIMINTSVIDRRKLWEYLGSGVLMLYSPIILAPNFIATCVPRKDFVSIFGVIDMYENKIVAASVSEFNRKENTDLLKSQIYGTFITLKGKQR